MKIFKNTTCHGFGDSVVITGTEDTQRIILCSLALGLPSFHTTKHLVYAVNELLVGLFLKPLNNIPIGLSDWAKELRDIE